MGDRVGVCVVRLAAPSASGWFTYSVGGHVVVVRRHADLQAHVGRLVDQEGLVFSMDPKCGRAECRRIGHFHLGC